MAFRFVDRMFPAYDEPGDTGAGGGGAEGAAGAGNEGAKPVAGTTGADGKPVVSTQVAPGAGGGGGNVAAEAARKAEETRNAGILADLQKERKARQTAEANATRLQADYDREQKRVRALAGLENKSPADVETDAVRERFAQLYPGLAKLTDAQIEKILATAERADSLDEATTHHWQTHGRQMLDNVVAGVAKAIGGALSDRQTASLKRAYVQEAEANPEFLKRHEAGDPKLIEEFVKNFLDDWYEPARRNAVNHEAQRLRRVPSARDRSIAGQGGKKLDFNDPKAVEDAMVASFKENGGEFGG